MKSRSRIHMLTVAAARLESDYANPKLVADLREAAKHAASRKVDGLRDETAQAEMKRIERQRNLMTMLPDTRSLDTLKEAMLQRAYDLMWDGDCAGTDALTEFLPSRDVTRMFEAWEQDQIAGDQPRSPFYDHKGKTP